MFLLHLLHHFAACFSDHHYYLSPAFFSSMTSSLSSMNGSCLQQREASSYPYMFHDPLHSLSSSYNHSRAAAVSAACNSAVAHQNSVNSHSSYAGVSSGSGGSGTGMFSIIYSLISMVIFCCVGYLGVISAGVSVPVQIPSQAADAMSNYWPRLQ